jgi:hypothetical protein
MSPNMSHRFAANASSIRYLCSGASLGLVFFAATINPGPVRAQVLAAAKRPVAEAAQAAQPAAVQYTGPGSCSSSSCHGSVQPRKETRVLQNEYSTWVVRDRHAKAFEVLSGAVAQRMARILKLSKAEEAPKCLACHALAVPVEKQARTFSLRDGVSCENCHGPASAWLGPHTTRGWTHAQSVAAGMIDTKNLVKRTEKCLSCHLGTADNFVDHEMIAAGHPDLYFELAAFTATMPAHWKEPLAEDPWREVRAWSVGQAVQLREALEQLARRADRGSWPEFAELQCYACHHALTTPEQSWRQERGYAGRRAGDPPWNASRFVVLRSLARMANPDASRQLEEAISRIAELTSRVDSDRKAVAATARAASAAADALARQSNNMKLSPADVLRLQKLICADGDYIAQNGERAAEQAAMALDSIFTAYARNVHPQNEKAVREAIEGLFQQVQNPSAFRPQSFSAQMGRVNALLGGS